MALTWWTRSIVAEPTCPAPMAVLRRVAHIHGDPTYDVTDHDYPFDRWLALRCVSGAGGLTLANGSRVQLAADGLLLVQQRDLKAFRCEAEAWELWWFEFLGPPPPLPSGRGLVLPGAAAEVPACAACLRDLAHPQVERRSRASARFQLLLAGWSADCRPEQRHSDDDRIDRVLAAMLERPDGSLTSGQLAAVAGVGERRLRQLCTAVLGAPPLKAYARLRAEMAAELLREHRCGAEDAAARFGFADRSHLARVLRQHLGTSPGRLRHG